jgi:hypothetical protein
VREARLMEHARAHGYPAPRIHEVADDTLVLERIDGPPMQAELERRPWRIAGHVRAFARLHHRLRAIEPVVIDWTNAAAGEPALDPALTAVIFRSGGGIPGRVATPDAIAYGLADSLVLPQEKDRLERLRRRYR